METNYFTYNGVKYYAGTIVEVRENKRELFNHWSVIRFVKCDNVGMYCFSSLHDIWTLYKLSSDQLQVCIEKVLKAQLTIHVEDGKMDPKYIDGIVEAWTWYLLAMFCAPFVKGIGNVIIIWVFASIIFFTWRNNKINRK